MSETGFPRYTKASQKGNQGVRIVENIIHDQFGWVFREQEGQKDFGIDAHIELMDGELVLGRMLAAQIKCGPSFFRKKNQDGYLFRGEQKHLNYFLNYPVPVLIILCDPKTERCWWSTVDPLEIESTKSGWQITVPFNQTFDIGAKKTLVEIAGPVRDYIPELQHYWEMNNLLQKGEILIIVASREDVENGDISMVLNTLVRTCLTKRSLTRKHQDKVDVSIYGYENDSRELYEIPEVRAWARNLDNEFPYWFFFLAKGKPGVRAPGLMFLTFALCNYHRVPDGRAELDKTSWSKFMDKHFVAMNQICLSLDFSEAEIKSLSERVLAYYVGSS